MVWLAVLPCLSPVAGFVRRHLEICAAIRRTFESVIFTDLFPNSQIEIFLQILQNDGPPAV